MECPECKNTIDDKVFYCPICGKKIKEKPESLMPLPVAGLFALNLFLPPLGLPWTIRYIKSPDKRAKTIGWLALGLMLISLIFGVWWALDWAKKINEQVNGEMDRLLGF